ncbi:MAG: hypothetical protein QOI09_1112 [Chloroflexota bacterium]|nr:hypothetical protein [Chloroflexota bacterium]
MDPRFVVGLLVAFLGAWFLLVVALWLMRPRDARLGELVRLVPDLLRLVRSLLADRSVPVRVRLALIGLLAYLINPIDLIPEFIPVLGPLDDVIVAILVLRYVRRRLGDDELRRRWPGTADGYELLGGILR